MRRSWLWFALTVVGFFLSQVVGYIVSSRLGFGDENYGEMTAVDRWTIVLATAPFALVPSFLMFRSGRHEAKEGHSKAPMYIGAAIFFYLFVLNLLGGLGVTA